MKDLFSVDYRESIRSVVRKEMKLKYGIKIPKFKDRDKNRADETDCKCKCFGVQLDKVPSKNIKDDQYFTIPLFLFDAFNYLNNHLNVEGLFRKSGSTGRQKILREMTEKEGTFTKCDFLNPHDIASLVKQFFRELPNPLFTSQLTPSFLKCLTINNSNDSHDAILMCTLLLPDEHLRVLKYLVKCVNKIANHSLETKMTIQNLGIVFAPNLLSVSGKDRNSEKAMRETTEIVDVVFKNEDKIGMVADELFDRAASLHLDGAVMSSFGDEVEDNCLSGGGARRGRTMDIQSGNEKKRDRSKSITAFLRRGFKSTERLKFDSSDVDRDIHGATISPQRWVKNETMQKLQCGSVEEENYMKDRLSNSSLGANGGSKRSLGTKTALSPVRKSPRLEEAAKNKHPTISLPVVKTISNQVAVTPRKKFLNVEPGLRSAPTKDVETPILPSKFDISRARVRTCSVKGKLSSQSSQGGIEGDCDEGEEDEAGGSRHPQSRVSRQTQKPHVKKSKRTSSLDRRRARYQNGTPTNIRRALPKTPLSESNEVSVFQDENLTANIAFMDEGEGEVEPMDTDPSFTINSVASRPPSSKSKIPKWNSGAKMTENSAPCKANTKQKTSSISEESHTRPKSSTKSSRERGKLRKSISLSESRTSESLIDHHERQGVGTVRKKVGRTHSQIPTPTKKSSASSMHNGPPQLGHRQKPPRIR